ncbi:MAG TPA: GNAT family N-acetyltransferase [Thermoanaerobaculia bacterium]|nr:GNAT family N-acetyltransferase [Thermoanaerobaculia bacterium]
MKIRRASIADAEELTQVAHESKSHWGYPPRWIELWRDDLTITPEVIAGNELYLAEEDGTVLGFFGLIAGEGGGPVWTLEHFWVLPAAMGKGVGRTLFERARELAAGAGAAVLEIDADPNAAPFYERMGARRVGEVRSEIEGQPRVRPLLHLDLHPAA